VAGEDERVEYVKEDLSIRGTEVLQGVEGRLSGFIERKGFGATTVSSARFASASAMK
jgi:hypothetical protein